jgi:hypothetical protein
MKKLASISAFSFLAFQLLATPVVFNLASLAGGGPNNRSITLTPDRATNNAPLIWSNSIVAWQTLTLAPAGGVVTQQLLPWGFTGRVDGAPSSFHFVVPNQTNAVNVTALITNAVAIGYPVTLYFAATNINNAAGTNVDVSGIFYDANGSLLQANLFDAAGSAAGALAEVQMWLTNGVTAINGQDLYSVPWSALVGVPAFGSAAYTNSTAFYPATGNPANFLTNTIGFTGTIATAAPSLLTNTVIYFTTNTSLSVTSSIFYFAGNYLLAPALSTNQQVVFTNYGSGPGGTHETTYAIFNPPGGPSYPHGSSNIWVLTSIFPDVVGDCDAYTTNSILTNWLNYAGQLYTTAQFSAGFTASNQGNSFPILAWTNYPLVLATNLILHFNLTTYTNGVVVTNIFQ